MSEKAKYKILFVDDEIVYHKIAKKYLEGWDVEFVFSVEDALKALKKDVYAVVITDIKMPETDGIALLKEIKSQFSATQVIVITASKDVWDLMEVLNAGANDIILKPLEKKNLIATINNSLDKLRRWQVAFADLFEFHQRKRLK